MSPSETNPNQDTLRKLKSLTHDEPIASFLKIKTLELSPGYAKVSMNVRPEYLNFNNFIFGGMIAAVAD